MAAGFFGAAPSFVPSFASRATSSSSSFGASPLRDADATGVFAVIGGRDTWTPETDVAALRATGVTVALYPDAEHGFAHDASRPSHRKIEAADAFERARAWLNDD